MRGCLQQTKVYNRMKKAPKRANAPRLSNLVTVSRPPDTARIPLPVPESNPARPASDSEPTCHKDWSRFSRCRIRCVVGVYPLTQYTRRIVHRMWSGQRSLMRRSIRRGMKVPNNLHGLGVLSLGPHALGHIRDKI